MMIPIASLLLALTIRSDADAFQLNRQGRDLLEHHRYPAAVRVFQKAVDRANIDLGPDDPATAMMLRNLALSYIESGNPRAAEPFATRALSIFESRFGAADAGLSPILNVLAECYASTGHLEAAQRAAERAVAIGPDGQTHYGTALHNLGAIRELLGDMEGAASWYRRAIAVKIEMLGAAHPYVAWSKTALRRVEREQRLALRPHSIRLEQAAE